MDNFGSGKAPHGIDPEQASLYLAAIVDSSDDAIIGKTLDGLIVSWNRSAEALYGYTAQEALGCSIELLVPPDAPNDVPLILAALRRGERVEHYETVRMTKDRRHVNVALTVSPVYDADGAIIGASTIARDITERKQAEAALRQAHEELERRVQERTAQLTLANEEVGRFAYIVSHDLRAPLINLKGFAGELRDLCELLKTVLPQLLPHLNEPQRTEVSQAVTENGPEALSYIETSVTLMDGLIRAVLELSRAGQRELQIEPVDTEALAQHVAQTLMHQLTQLGGRLTIKPLPTVNADHTAMEQVLGNLLGNAVKYLDPGRPGEITIRSERETDATRFEVCDNGRGIAEDDLPRVFELFRRVGRQDTAGEGMGLTYVQTLIRRHGGEITCQSTLGVGTTFSFTIAHDLVSEEPNAAS